MMRLTRFDYHMLAVILGLVSIIGVTITFGTQEEPLRIAYLKFVDNAYQVFIADPTDPDGAEQVTTNRYGVFDFSVNSDGTAIAYTERDFETGTSEIMLLDLRTRDVKQLTNCLVEESECNAPVFRPGSEMIAYQRRNLNTSLGLSAGSSRIWLLDILSNTTYPLFEEAQILGYTPTWSADGSRLAFFDSVQLGVQVYDFEGGDQPMSFVPSRYGEVGTLSPDGTKLIFPEIQSIGVQNQSYIQSADLDKGIFETIVDPNEPVDDQFPTWSPDGQSVLIGRRYTDERFTIGAQVYLLDPETMAIEELIYDPGYSHSLFSWSPDSQQIAMVRFEQLQSDDPNYGKNAQEIWVYNMETSELTKIDDNAFAPKWVNN